MTISGIVLDEFVSGGGTALEYTTITIVTICFLLSFSVFCIRLQQIVAIKEDRDEQTYLTKIMLQICHLSAMFFSCFHIFLYEWNYLHLYLDYNAMDCSLWFILIITSLTFSKMFLYSFLMLRSSLSFRDSMFQIPLQLSIIVTTLSITSQLTMMSLMLSDFTPVSPFVDKSLCFRTLGPTATAGITGFNVSDALSNAIALFIFWRKSKLVKKLLFTGPQISNITGDKSTSVMNGIFKKHIFLGILITTGSVLIFFAGEFLTILLGVASTLHELCNNIYIFLLFKENQKVYNILCCQCHTTRMNNIEAHLNHIQIELHGDSNDVPKVNPRMKRIATTSVNPSKSLSIIPRTVTSIVYRKNSEKDVKSLSLMDIYNFEDKKSNSSSNVETDRNKLRIEENERRNTILTLHINTNTL